MGKCEKIILQENSNYVFCKNIKNILSVFILGKAYKSLTFGGHIICYNRFFYNMIAIFKNKKASNQTMKVSF